MANAPKRAGRPAAIPLHPGARHGHLVILRRQPTKEGLRYSVRCDAPLKDGKLCGKVFLTKTQYLTRKPNPQTHCGCQTHIDANPYKYEKVCWQAMHLRCEYQGHVSYKDYGGRGIKICARWHKSNPDGFKNFVADMGPAPNPSEKEHIFTVDRKDPDGNYEKDNCKWADKVEQANNQRRHKVAAAVIEQRKQARLAAMKQQD